MLADAHPELPDRVLDVYLNATFDRQLGGVTYDPRYDREHSWPKSFIEVLYIEGAQPSAAPRDVTLRLRHAGASLSCEDIMKLTAIRAEMNPVTSGTNPIPYNPAIVATLTPIAVDLGVLFWDANSFALTSLQPNIDLTNLPITWTFEVTEGFLNPTAQVLPAANRRSARLEIPFPSWGNLGTGRMEFRTAGQVCTDVPTVIKNVQPDLEPGDFRFQVKLHLCHNGEGTSTVRTESEVRAIMADVTKVLTQCGILVSIGAVVTSQVDPVYMKLDSTSMFDMWRLFLVDRDSTMIDVYFINAIDFNDAQECGLTSGVTGTPAMSGIFFTGGIAIPDNACDANNSGQEIVRTLAHELAHYLFNHTESEVDHVYGIPENLMSPGVDEQKRDLTESQCLELRTNATVD